MNVFVAILGLAALILIHEAGHFFTALLVGMKPRSFNIGFGPPLAKTTRNGIIYAVRAIPLGGYVKIPGMHRPASKDVEVHFARALHEVPELVGPIDRLRRRLGGDEVDAVGAQDELERLREAVLAAPLSGAALDSALRGLQEIGDSVSHEAYWRQRTWKRVAVVAAGPLTNILVAIVLFTVLYATATAYLLGFSLRGNGNVASRTVASVSATYPAARIGLRPGDTIVAVNGKSIPPGHADQISKAIRGSHGRPVRLTVVRHGRVVVLKAIRPHLLEAQSVPRAAWSSVKLTGIVTREIAKSLVRLVHKSERKQLSSTVGIVQASSNAASQGVQAYLWVLGLISLSLALFNLLPLLPLDGGHIVFSLIEGVRGRAVRRAIYERASAIGIALMLLLFVVGLSNDIGRLSGG